MQVPHGRAEAEGSLGVCLAHLSSTCPGLSHRPHGISLAGSGSPKVIKRWVCFFKGRGKKTKSEATFDSLATQEGE